MGNSTYSHDDYLVFDEPEEAAGDHAAASPAAAPVWPNPIRLLIVDDEPEVHAVTRYALGSFRFNDQPLEFLSAHSSAEAARLLEAHADIALILLDVVMETEDAGLRLTRHIREQLNNSLVRIILRTGQPGRAPEHRVIVDYDINDYKNKDELTADRLFTSVYTAIRTYRQLQAMERGRLGLEKVVAASASLFEQRSMQEFVQGVVLQIHSFVEYADGAILCALAEPGGGDDLAGLRVIAGSGPFETARGREVAAVVPDAALDLIREALRRRTCLYAEIGSVIVFDTYSQCASLVYLNGRRPLHPVDRQLLEFFCAKVAVGFDNVYLYEQLTYGAEHDVLTGLLNRNAFVRALTARLEALGKAGDKPKPGDGLGVVVIGLDRFKDINNDLGYDSGDRVLKAMAGRLGAALSGRDLACRLVGDTFGLLLAGVASGEDLAARCEALRLTLSQPLMVQEIEVVPILSIGHGFVDARGDPAFVVLADAERAMASAKRFGGYRCEKVAPRREHPPGGGRVGLLRDLTYALRRDEFLLRYQPIIRSRDRRLTGFEALLRWQHPVRGLVAPGRFLDIAESTSLIVPIGNWVIRTALHQAGQWNGLALPGEHFRVSVNVSARQLMTDELLAELTRWLALDPVIPGQLKLEVTESLLVEDADRAERMLTRIKALGVRLSLDDFGTGFSSLSYLHRFPFDSLKLDQVFIRTMFERRESMQIVKSVIALAKGLNIETIAEGVETEEQARVLGELGCDYFQGYLFGQPLTAEAATGRVGEFYRRTPS